MSELVSIPGQMIPTKMNRNEGIAYLAWMMIRRNGHKLEELTEPEIQKVILSAKELIDGFNPPSSPSSAHD